MSGIKNPHLSVDFCVATGEILLTEHMKGIFARFCADTIIKAQNFQEEDGSIFL